MFHKPPDGFQAFDRHGEVTMYHRHLPHWRQKGATYFVTFRLADSLPQEKLNELKNIREEWKDKHFGGLEPESNDNESIEEYQDEWKELTRLVTAKSEKWLDQGYGKCVLKELNVREIVIEALENFDGEQYELGAYVIMPNHVHLIMRPLGGNELENILQGRKRRTSREINKLVSQGGNLWQQESYDRIIRDAEHLWKTLQYIGRNPAKANISENHSTLWICKNWIDHGWDFIKECKTLM